MTCTKDPENPHKDHYLNCLEPDVRIHRYCKIDELYWLVHGKLTLTCPSKWRDKFENPLLRSDVTNQDGIPVPLKELRRKFYGKAWSLEEESDALWRLYGDKGEGVQITVKSSDLLFQAHNAYDLYGLPKGEIVYTKIGKVRYLDEAKLRKKYEPVDEFYNRFMKSNGEGFFESLLDKLQAYSYENEVRLIAWDFDGRFGCSETMRLEIPVCGCDWIERVTFGPAVGKDTYKAHRKRLTKLGLLKKKIYRSQLYGKLHYPSDLGKLRP